MSLYKLNEQLLLLPINFSSEPGENLKYLFSFLNVFTTKSFFKIKITIASYMPISITSDRQYKMDWLLVCLVLVNIFRKVGCLDLVC